MEVQVNYLAILLAMVSSMVIGSIWYAKSVFGKKWAKLARVDTSKMNSSDAWKPMVATLVVSLITAYVLAHMSYISNQFFGNSFMQDTLNTAFWLWLGFTAARFITHDGFEGRPMQLTVLNLGNELATIMVMGLVIGSMGI